MNNTEVIDILEQIENLPTLPVVAQQVLQLVEIFVQVKEESNALMKEWGL